MSDIEAAPPADEKPASPAGPPWSSVTLADLADVDFEEPIAGASSASCDELHDLYGKALSSAAKSASPTEQFPLIPIFRLLEAVTSMYLKPHEQNDPYGPSMSSGNQRTAIPSDFCGEPVKLLAEMANRAANPVLRARLADISWTLERKRGNLALSAISSYIDIIDGVEAGTLKFQFVHNDGALEGAARDLLHRTLYIARASGWDKEESVRARTTVMELRKKAAKLRAAIPLIWFSELDLDFSLSDPDQVAATIEEALPEIAMDVHIRVQSWRLAARGYHAAKRNTDRDRCIVEASNTMVAEADRLLTNEKSQSAILAAHQISSAIYQLHGVAGMRERRTRLRHRLIDMQAHIPEEMPVMSHEMDLSDVVQGAEKAVTKDSLLDALFGFAGMSKSPDPNDLKIAAVKSIGEFPLQSLFPAIHFDRSGKVVHKSSGADLKGDPGDSAIQQQITLAESVRRNVLSAGIEVGRQNIMRLHFLSEGFLASILQRSFIVPHELIFTFSKGFLRFFQGDPTSALYTLTPLVEASLRYVLKLNGIDVSIFDDATQTQQDRTISSLFEQMRDDLDRLFTKSITADIENLFLRRPGPQIRHDLAHGLLSDGSPYGPDALYACWFIFRLCLLPLFPHIEQLRLEQSSAG